MSFRFQLLQRENITGEKPLMIYLHRYPLEDERFQFSGTEMLLKKLREKYDVVYVGMNSVKEKDSALREGIALLQVPGTVDRASGLDKTIKLGLYYLLFGRLCHHIKRLKPAVVMCREPLPFVPARIMRLGVPTIVASVSDHWWQIFLGFSRKTREWGKRIERWEVRRWNRGNCLIFANTQAEYDLMVRYGADPAKLKIINATGLDTQFFPCDASNVREDLFKGEDVKLFAIHGTIRPGKGYGQLLEWWKKLVAIHPNWRLLIIGGAGGEQWCRNLVSSLGLEREVLMTGWLPTQADVNRHLNAADYLLAIRRFSDDNVGIIPSVLFHNLAIGKPTIATHLPGMAEIVQDRVNGFLFEPDDYDSFRTTLEYVVEHPDEAEQIARAGIDRVHECFDAEHTAEQTVGCVEELLCRIC